VLAATVLCLLLAPDPVAEAEAEAAQALTENRISDALEDYETALRAAEETPVKARERDAYLKAGWADPPTVKLAELEVLALHVRQERLRVWGQAADRLQRDKMPNASIVVRRAIAELAGEGSDTAKQQAERIKGIVRKLTQEPSDEEKALAKQIVERSKDGGKALDEARRLLGESQWKLVVRICQEVLFGEHPQEIQNRANALREETERAAEHALPDDQRAAAYAVLTDERFDRLAVERSRHFLFLGPRAFVEAIDPRQRMMLDLAYIYQSDLAQQLLTADGSRLVLYYQETFDFGGGLAGGKLIRIGSRAIRMPVAGMLHYHELGHCIFGRGWLHPGFTEGLADFAAGFTLDSLAQTQQAQRFVLDAREAFVRFFLGRAVRYFDIQSYRPSAGFLFSFLPPGEAPFDWAPYRRVFRRMREAQFGQWPEREHQIMRYFGYLMATEYGPALFDRLAEYGWPVERVDYERIPLESEELIGETRQGEFWLGRGETARAELHFRTVLERGAVGHLAARARHGLLRVALKQGDDTRAATLRGELGIVDAFKVCGPFHAHGRTAHVVLPPETAERIDPEQPVQYGYETAPWKPCKVDPDGYVDLRRKQGFGYPEDACAFALTWVFTDSGGPARIWLGSDDGHTLYVNGALIEKRATHRGFRFDDDFDDVELRPGWNRLLLKVHNGNGEWGFLMRLTARDGTPLPGLRVDADSQEERLTWKVVREAKAARIVEDDFRKLSSARWLTAVGSFDTQNGRLRPQGTEHLGLWQRFQVDPDKPPDGPANILWLKDGDLVRADSIEATVEVAGPGSAPPGKFGITIDGENENDGQSGHTLVFDRADGKLACHWYRYDQLLYLQPGVEVPDAESYRFVVRRVNSRWWVLVNDVPVFDGVDAQRLPASGVGLLTWGRAPLFETVRVDRLEPANR